MSTGLVICSKCFHEVHQQDDHSWKHCDLRTTMCSEASPIYPSSPSQIKGKYCGSDQGYNGSFKEEGYFPEPLGSLQWMSHDEDSTSKFGSRTVNIGRNDPCPCRSGKKFKKCCIDKMVTQK